MASYSEHAGADGSDAPALRVHRGHRPAPPARAGRVLHVWAALSGAIALFASVVLLVVSPPHWWLWAVTIAVGLATVEAAAEGRLRDNLRELTSDRESRRASRD